MNSMEQLKKTIFQSAEFTRLRESLASLDPAHPVTVKGAAGSLLAFAVSLVFEERASQVLFVASGEDRAEKLRDDCALLAGEQNICYFGARPAHPAQALDMTAPVSQIETLATLVSARRTIIVASPQAIAEKLPLPGDFRKDIIDISSNAEQNFEGLIARLIALGFDKKDFVEGYGDFAVRGGILDVFPYMGENPLRLEFWGNTVESIREFDLLSQRSIRPLEKASILPDLHRDAGGKQSGVSLLEFLRDDAVVIMDEPAIVRREIEELFKEGLSDIFTFEEIALGTAKFPVITNAMFTSEASGVLIDIPAAPQPLFNGSIERLTDAMVTLASAGDTIWLTCDTKEEAVRLGELIEEVVTSPSSGAGKVAGSLAPVFLAETLHSGFVFPGARVAVFTEHEIFGRLKRRGLAKKRRFRGISQKELQQLRRGDYVVHADHGIGTFSGLAKIRVGGVDQEVMKLLFLEKDVLYVNLNFIGRVQKYSSQEGHVPALSKLGAPDWERAKKRAKKRIKDIARDLIALYARRKLEKGFGFSADTHWQKELEASFMYEDTPDQASATSDVKHDMESSSPMDRLVCGDVGFGKTEVAVRAAFKAVMDGKQVALLVPTTILALQHYNTFRDRLSRYTTRIENLTRFRSKKEQMRVLSALNEGSVDIVVGTHRLLSGDVGFKDLGLLIIDEEHRFGVSAKEKLRKMKATVDTLTLTATPIPRSLHMSLMGARDLSIINTPPRNRLPIITEIVPATEGRETHWRVIREAVLKELHRGGQVYFVHDRVHTIDTVAERLRQQVKEARFHVAHGQMAGHELEKTMLEFLERKYDVLIATKIIESGLDIPNVNTIIINRADHFGLAELYQLRGRVGRSNIQAFAYLLVPPLTVLPKQTLRRLQAIEEFTELGSGFNLAMRDLEIRGAGNIFGAEQSGYIMEMGIEMYERIVREAVEELRQEEFKDILNRPGAPPGTAAVTETIIESDIESLIPDFYIESDAERLDIYRRLYRISQAGDIHSMRNELKDRFGEYPEEVENLFALVELRLFASRSGIPKLAIRKGLLVITLPEESALWFYGAPDDEHSPFQQIMRKIALKETEPVRLEQSGKELTLRVAVRGTDGVEERLSDVRRILEELFGASGGGR